MLDEIDGELWDGPKGWRKLFKVLWINLLTPVEQKQLAAGKKTFDVAELVDLYQLANDRERLYLLLGLNCAFGQGEISTLMRSDIDFKTSSITRTRHKTRDVGVIGSWVLWKEASDLLKANVAGPNKGDLAEAQERETQEIQQDRRLAQELGGGGRRWRRAIGKRFDEAVAAGGIDRWALWMTKDCERPNARPGRRRKAGLVIPGNTPRISAGHTHGPLVHANKKKC